ncbi:MAG: hypothetical protein N2560_10435 [Ignavibacteria bacterium]|nr:hypothetical protein [Ignavibacteria bacterium]
MKKINWLIWLLSISLLLFSFPIDLLFAKGGKGSFGGTRSYSRSFGGTKSFGGTRSFRNPSSSPRYSTPMRSYNNPQTRSFGGSATSIYNRSQIQSKYGVPRKVLTPREIPNLPANARVYDYGDFASGLMMGYLMGHTSWLWALPFHPAFYYSQPIKVVNEDGTVTYYPPTFDTGKFLMTLIIAGSIAFIIIRAIRRKKGILPKTSKMDLSRSSFS